MTEQHPQHHRDPHHNFIDFKNAFDRVFHEGLWQMRNYHFDNMQSHPNDRGTARNTLAGVVLLNDKPRRPVQGDRWEFARVALKTASRRHCRTSTPPSISTSAMQVFWLHSPEGFSLATPNVQWSVCLAFWCQLHCLGINIYICSPLLYLHTAFSLV